MLSGKTGYIRIVPESNTGNAKGNVSKPFNSELEHTEASDRTLGTGCGSVEILSEDWAQPMSDEEADAFWEGRW